MIVYPLAAACWIGMILHHALGDHFTSDPSLSSLSYDFLAWMVMIGAMMLPTTLPAVDDVMRRSYRRRRLTAAVEFALGYMVCWGAAGSIFLLLRLHSPMNDRLATALVCLLAALWALLPVRRIWFAQCHRQIPLCPVGWRADWDSVRQGATQGVPCVKMCWLLMVACGISGHDWVMMIGGTVLAVKEKRMFRLNRAPIVVGSIMLAAWFLIQVARQPDSDLPLQNHHHH
jgi:predicted metal-binding membrane protein